MIDQRVINGVALGLSCLALASVMVMFMLWLTDTPSPLAPRALPLVSVPHMRKPSIPKVLHFFGIGTEALAREWGQRNPSFHLRIWHKEELEHLLSIHAPGLPEALQADANKCVVLYLEGGWHFSRFPSAQPTTTLSQLYRYADDLVLFPEDIDEKNIAILSDEAVGTCPRHTFWYQCLLLLRQGATLKEAMNRIFLQHYINHPLIPLSLAKTHMEKPQWTKEIKE